MERPLAEPGQEADGEQVEQPLDEPGDAVLRRAEPPGAVVDLDLADPEPSRVRQDGDEPVQLAVDADLVEHLAAVDLEPAVVVVELAAGQAR